MDGGRSGVAQAVPGADVCRRLRAVADAILYEGYLLYPYRRSSPKNRVRWQFGVLAPREWAERDGPVPEGISGSADSWYQQTECLFRAAPTARLRLTVRYLHQQHKQVERRAPDGRHLPVESLEAAGAVHLTFDEAVPRETDVSLPLAQLLRGPHRVDVGAPAGRDTEVLAGGAGRVVRRRDRVHAVTTVQAEPVGGDAGQAAPAGPRLYRLRIRTENTGRAPGGAAAPRADVLRHALIATHTLVAGDGIEFLSLTDPPPGCEEPAGACRNVRTFPVLGGEPGRGEALLSSPIILPDHPQVAPESPGDLHDAAEIDEILSLRTLLLTDDEKREARATDQRAADILDRVETMPPEMFARLHGAIRSLTPVHASTAPSGDPAAGPGGAAPRATVPWWQEGGDEGLSPTTDSVPVDGVPVAAGSRVRLRPAGRGADAQDMFLAGRTARVAAVFHDVDGSVHLAVTLDDDPAAELDAWYGRFRYFRPHELKPLTPATDEDGRHGRP
ncbi:hypothetical protein MUU72_04540 [Streptomyces sp. RS10V-4]|uniref:hypothetical protein n=1 Tax=Streptomyces rhizoryzae TaxID=2932493 RepID=UPI002006CD57|nr:hypothetical protein [Streptomyces rhizoryzae]MCK7622392.1 hypothetical protein [Streptomyces rhizoryzae]